mmetsp:Transcript_86332/g.252635  ORF Transcript_86332/g.252635 Transcript_86332/m.252635 type:complete len:705 (+) Transcript_86332:55-2169(+)
MYGANLQTIPTGVDGQAALETLRKRVFGPDGPALGSAEAATPYLRSDHMLVRFLIARQWDVEKAAAMLREHYKWLAETKMSALLKDHFPEEPHIKKFYPQAYHGTDKLGRPVYIERPGCIDMPRLLQVTTPERLLDYVYAGTELQIRRRLPACSLVRGEVVDKSLNIMDLDGLGFRVVTHTTARRVVRDIVTMLQNHYPECSGRMIIINAPKVFSIAWSFVKPMLDEKTVAKISIYGTDRHAYTEALLELVEADQLPALFGGKCVCDGKDHISCMRSVKGPWADPEVQAVLDSQPLERVMTPEGAKLLLQRRACEGPLPPIFTGDAPESSGANPSDSLAGAAVPAAAAAVPAAAAAEPAAPEAPVAKAVPEGPPPATEPPLPAPAPAAVSPPQPLDVQLEAEAENEERDSFELAVPGIARSRSAMILPEVTEAERGAGQLLEEYQRLEEVHMKTLTQWVEEYNTLVRDIGRHVIERAQGYYDSRSLWQQVVQEYARQQEEVDLINRDLEKAVKNLSKAEGAFASFMETGRDISDEEWAKLAPLQAGDVGREAAAGDPKLMRTLRVSALADRVTSFQRQRDSAKSELEAKRQDLEDAKRGFEVEDQRHSGCTWNCSVKRAAPFYEKRRMHEYTVDTQLAGLRGVEQRLQLARQHVAALRQSSGSVPGSRSRGLDEMSLQSFEIAGGQPGQDEFHSCDSNASDDEA